MRTMKLNMIQNSMTKLRMKQCCYLLVFKIQVNNYMHINVRVFTKLLVCSDAEHVKCLAKALESMEEAQAGERKEDSCTTSLSYVRLSHGCHVDAVGVECALGVETEMEISNTH